MSEYLEQCTLFKSINSFNEEIDHENRWMKLAKLIPWDELNVIYLSYFTMEKHSVLKTCRLIVGMLIGQMIMQLSDRKIVQYFHENPYFQYFCGQTYAVFKTEKLIIHPSILSKRRKQLGPACLERFEDVLLNVFKQIGNAAGEQLMMDATVFPCHISYPNDVKLLNTVREWLCETILLVKNNIDPTMKIRTYRRVARTDFLNFQKKKKKQASFIRKYRKKMLNYVKRNLKQLSTLIAELESRQIQTISPAALKTVKDKMMTAQTIYDQQFEMAKTRGRSTPNRIVNFEQPNIRPIVRGKEGRKVEFGPKCHIALSDGFAFLNRFDFNSFNEGTDLKKAIQKHEKRFDTLPESVMADQIYANRENREFLKDHEVETSFKPVGRQPVSLTDEQRRKKQTIKILQKKRNQIEGAFGILKEHFNLKRITTRTASSAKFQILIGLMAFNLTRLLT